MCAGTTFGAPAPNTILLGADANSAVAHRLLNRLTAVGQVVHARAFNEAAGRLNAAAFDIVVLDENLPGPPVWGLIRLIQNGLYHSALPCLVIVCADQAVPLHQTEASQRGVGVLPYSRIDGIGEYLQSLTSCDARPRVLVVDDDPRSLRAAADALAKDFEVSTAANAATGLAAFEGEPFDLVVLDLNLPDGSGRELLQTIRERDPTQPVVILTAEHSFASQLSLIEEGAYNYFTKPFPMHRFAAECRLAINARGVESARKAKQHFDNLHGLLVAADRTLTSGRTQAGIMQLRKVLRRNGWANVTKQEFEQLIEQIEREEDEALDSYT